MQQLQALLWLTILSMKNRAVVRLRRLRQPRYAVGLLGGSLYFYAIFFHQSHAWSWASGHGSTLAALALLVLTALLWALPGPKYSLVFSKAEVQLLFPAPIARGQLLNYKLLTPIISVAPLLVMLTALYRPASAGEAVRYAAGTWLLIATLLTHFTAMSISRESLRRRGPVGQLLQRASLVAVIAVGVVLWPSVAPLFSHLTGTGVSALVADVERTTSSGAFAIVLWPFRALLRPPPAGSAVDFLAALPPALALLAINYFWALHADASFDEASAEQAQRIIEAQRRGGLAPSVRKTPSTPFNLAPTGRPEFAIAWKNFISLGRYASLKRLLIVMPGFLIAPVMLAVMLKGEPAVDAVDIILLFVLSMIVIFGAQSQRNDIRRDVEYLAVLKSWPVRGVALVRGELMAPSVFLTLLICLCVGVDFIVAADPLFGVSGLLHTTRPVACGVVALLASGAVVLQLVVQNALALMFPAWIAGRQSLGAGIEGMGQRMVLMVGGMLVSLVFAVPAATAAAIVGGVAYFMSAPAGVITGSVAGILCLAAECWVATIWLGRLFERMSPLDLDPQNAAAT